MRESSRSSSDIVPQVNSCPVCNKRFTCGSAKEGEACWCQDYPAIMPLDTDQGCLCPECLGRAIDQKTTK